MKRLLTSVLTCAFAMGAGAAPTVSDVRIETDADSPRLAVHYKLDADAVVTVRFAIDGTAIPDNRTWWVGGDVNAKVAATSGDAERTIYWAPDKEDWGEGGVPTLANLTATVTAWDLGAPPNYMVADLIATNCVRYYASAEAVPNGVTNAVYKTTKMVFRKIPAKNVLWKTGIVDTEGDNLRANRLCRLTADYYLGVYEVTQRQSYLFCAVLNHGSLSWQQQADSPRRAISGLNYTRLMGSADAFEPSATSYIGKFRALTGLKTANLPTENQWAYACHAGSADQAFWGGMSTGSSAKYAWTSTSVGGNAYPHEVGLLQPNPYGLYDILGNVWEMCLDYYENLPKAMNEASVVDDYVNTTPSAKRVQRGGNYANDMWFSRSASFTSGGMTSDGPWNYGYRLCCKAIAE